jgi:hypothetical protein
MTVHWTKYIHANLEFSGIPLLLGLDGVAVAGTELMGDVDIDAGGRILCVRLAAAKRGDEDVVIERGGPIWEAIFASVAVGLSDEIDAATADPDETYDSFVREHSLRTYEVL